MTIGELITRLLEYDSELTVVVDIHDKREIINISYEGDKEGKPGLVFLETLELGNLSFD